MTAAEPATGLHFAAALLPSGWAENVRLALSGGRIAAVETGAAPQPGDQRAAIGLPGMPNLHSHAFQRAMAGLAEHRGHGADGFWSWREAMYRFVARIGPEDLLAIAAMAQVEMLESGFTRVGEFHYLHHQPGGAPYADPATMAGALVAAAAETGIGLTLLPVAYAHAGFGARPPLPEQARFVTDAAGFARLVDATRAAARALPDAVVGVAPHSLRAVAAADLAPLAALAEGGPVHIHVAEQIREVEECLAHTGARPVEYLLGEAPVDARWCLVHATHVTPQELAAIAARDAVVGLCPITEANLGDGLFPAGDFLAAGGRIGIGSDSNVLVSMAEELRLLEYGQRLMLRTRSVLASAASPSTGRRLFDACASGGAQALGAAGGLTAGASADVLALDPDHPALVGRSGDALLDSLVFAAGAGAVREVWRAGRRVVVEGRHRAREAVTARYRAVLARLLA